jgi:putative transposase
MSYQSLEGYFAPAREQWLAEQRAMEAEAQARGEERLDAASRDPLKRPRRWVVERLHSWLNRSRRLLVRWEKLERTYLAFVHLACALLCFQQCDRFKAAPVSE